MNILIDDIPVNLQQMVDIIDMDKLIELWKVYGCASIYTNAQDFAYTWKKQKYSQGV